ncbi:hypothetical protein BLNAU_12255 [Blattamonas nauphoetae]|uniref:Uncharacterized protein n=1 Tax=Blattamonas nauphoetae TaxID=2049346 RepID=A0ABQ9XN12_9EUKA|nr:hypothetical protein BLNAU_12255 [Blattamonas nauphoetae]
MDKKKTAKWTELMVSGPTKATSEAMKRTVPKTVMKTHTSRKRLKKEIVIRMTRISTSNRNTPSIPLATSNICSPNRPPTPTQTMPSLQTNARSSKKRTDNAEGRLCLDTTERTTHQLLRNILSSRFLPLSLSAS